jgi:hypothetical protein
MKVRSPGKAGAASRDDVSEKDAGRGQSVPSANVQNRELPYSKEKKMFEIFCSSLVLILCKQENAF